MFTVAHAVYVRGGRQQPDKGYMVVIVRVTVFPQKALGRSGIGLHTLVHKWGTVFAFDFGYIFFYGAIRSPSDGLFTCYIVGKGKGDSVRVSSRCIFLRKECGRLEDQDTGKEA